MEYIDAKTIIRKCPPTWDYLWFDFAMDLYRGCSHGCIYCYARSSYYEKTEDFSNIRAKKNALQIVRDELRRKIKTGVMLVGGMSDTYNPWEKELQLTRNSLELLNAFGFGVCIITKSKLVVRDTDIFTNIKQHSPASVNFSITCSDDAIGKKIEPCASTTTERFEALGYLSKNGITAGVMMDPMVPFVTDTEENVREMVKKSKHYGASYIYLSTQVTMADIQRDYFLHEGEKRFPGISQKFRARYKNYYRCRPYESQKLWGVFAEECDKENIQCNLREFNQTLMRETIPYQMNLFT